MFADITGPRDVNQRDDEQHLSYPHPSSDTKSLREPRYSQEPRDVRDARDFQANREARRRSVSRSAREFNRSSIREPSRGAGEPSRRDPSRSTRDINRESRELRDNRDSRELRDNRDSRELRDNRDSRESRDNRDSKSTKEAEHQRESSDFKYYDHREAAPGPPPYQEIADANLPPPPGTVNTAHSIHTVGSTSNNNANNSQTVPTHPSGITPTERCVQHAISVPVDWVIHPSAPHFVICGRCYVDRIYDTHQWQRDFVKYSPVTSMSLRCHLGAIPHMEKRWAKVHTADEFLAFIKVMQRKKVAPYCPGHVFPSSSASWYSTPSIPGMRICQECRQRLFGGTAYSKRWSHADFAGSSICHGSFHYTTRMVDALLDDDDWDYFVEAMRMRIRFSSCSKKRDGNNSDAGSWCYRYTKSLTKDYYICEACFLDYVHKTEAEGLFTLGDRLLVQPQCMASLKCNQMPDSADVEYTRAEIMRLIHGYDRRCYPTGTVGVKWYTTVNNPRGYGICQGCYQSKVKPLGGEKHFMVKKDVGKRSSFACWMNSYHPFFRRHDKLLAEGLILGDLDHFENAIAKFTRLPGCQQGAMGQGKNKRWWGWKSLRICAACVKGGSLAETQAGKKFELNGEKDPHQRSCDLYSCNMRDRFHHDDLATLLEFARKRQELLS
jgi:hypothetical protein